MDQIVEGNPVPEPREPIEPREIPGLDSVVIGESVGGNAGESRAGVNAIYMGRDADPQFIFTNYAEKDYGRPTNLTFRIIVPLKQMVEAAKKGQVAPPSLIDLVVTSSLSEEEETEITRRAIEHNAFNILRYLERGGKPEELSQTPLMPDLEALKAKTAQSLVSSRRKPAASFDQPKSQERGKIGRVRAALGKLRGH